MADVLFLLNYRALWSLDVAALMLKHIKGLVNSKHERYMYTTVNVITYYFLHRLMLFLLWLLYLHSSFVCFRLMLCTHSLNFTIFY